MSELRRFIDYENPIFGKLSFLPPDTWSFINLVTAGLAGWFYFLGNFPVGAILFLVSGIFDVIDGGVARYLKRKTKFGSILDATMDRIGEGIVYVGISKHYTAATLAMMTSFIVSYIRARDDRINVGIAERGDRMVIIAAASFLNLIEPALWAVIIFSTITVFMRLRMAKKLS